MAVNQENYNTILRELEDTQTTLVAVSKTKPAEDIIVLYELGQRDFGENYVQEMVDKAAQLPSDIRWHFIGHLQSNKVKYIAPFVYLVHGIDSEKLLLELDKQGKKIDRVIDCLLQVHIATEETKFGFSTDELKALVERIQSGAINPGNVRIRGLMGMASFTDDMERVKSEFENLAAIFSEMKKLIPSFEVLSMGMSADYRIAISSGSTMVRIGSLLFGAR
jgi:pyridoxal phosphate enzyme (YggS family)